MQLQGWEDIGIDDSSPAPLRSFLPDSQSKLPEVRSSRRAARLDEESYEIPFSFDTSMRAQWIEKRFSLAA